MLKLIFILVCMSMTLLGSSQSASFDCKYSVSEWSPLGTVYWCKVQSSVNIVLPNKTQVDSTTGTHLTGYNNDNVEAFQIYNKGQIFYFPQGLNKIFKNLKGIIIAFAGIKELHQNDLKDYPDLRSLDLSGSNLEILEENLFEFNTNLEEINLNYNRISHIEPNVFDKLTKLRSLNIQSSNCINLKAENNPMEVQNVINSAKSQCTNLDYSNLKLKVENLKIEKENLNSENFNEKLKNLENEVKSSKLSNTFYRRFQTLKAFQVKNDTTTTTAFPKITTTTTETPTTTTTESSRFETCSALESKIDKLERKIEEQNLKFEEKLGKIMNALNIGN